MASKTTFDHWKIVVSWGKVRKTRIFSFPSQLPIGQLWFWACWIRSNSWIFWISSFIPSFFRTWQQQKDNNQYNGYCTPFEEKDHLDHKRLLVRHIWCRILTIIWTRNFQRSYKSSVCSLSIYHLLKLRFMAGVHFSFDVLPSWADQGSCAHCRFIIH